MEKFYVPTAIAYTSGKPHIGNTYEIVLADAIARYKRLRGFDVFFMTGTDEHGEKIEKKASEQGITPKEFVDNVSSEIKRIWDLVGSSYDKFIRTTDENHVELIKKIFKKLYDQGDIYKGKYEGWYCTPCESFYTDTQLEDGKCPLCHREVYKASEEAYFFKMSKYADKLIKYIEEHDDFIIPEIRKNEMLNTFLYPGLNDLCVSRTSFTWGIPVDFDPKHVVYVWLDALMNYLSGIDYKIEGEQSEKFKKYWPPDLHVIGKDIVRFHTIYWPIFLMALDLPLPKHIYGHPWLLAADEDKMSKSKGNVLYADDLVNEYGRDAVRFYLLAQIPFDKDGTISPSLFIEVYNYNLANTLGNLVSRTVAMCNKYFGGVVTKGSGQGEDAEFINYTNDLKKTIHEKVSLTIKNMESLHIADAIENTFAIFQRCNKYIDETCPWVLAKNEGDKEKLKTVLYNLISGILIGTSLLEPIIPETCDKILSAINAKKIDIKDIENKSIDELFSALGTETKVVSSMDVLFKRLENEVK